MRLEGELGASKAAARGKPRGAQTNTTATSSAPAMAPASTGAAAPGATSAPAAEESGAADQAAHEPPYFMTPPDAPARPVWHWALGSFVVALGLGFALGWQVLDRRIRSKYGGLRIY